MIKALLFATGLAFAAVSAVAQTGPTGSFQPNDSDRAAIQAVLDTYVEASETRNEALFKTILLNDEITLSNVDQAVEADGRPHGTENYRSFRQGFDYPARKMRFRNVRIEQDGALAHVSLVFVKLGSSRSDWGFKSIQMLKVQGKWKIASELFTYHS